MPRSLRIEFPGAYWHVMAKLVARKPGLAVGASGSAALVKLEVVVPEEMIPVDVKVSDDGHFDATPTSQPTAFRLYHRPDPAANQAALRDALPALYLSFRSRSCSHVGLQPTRAKP